MGLMEGTPRAAGGGRLRPTECPGEDRFLLPCTEAEAAGDSPEAMHREGLSQFQPIPIPKAGWKQLSVGLFLPE